MCDVPDGELLGRFVRSKSEEAFAALVQRHINLVYSVAMRHTANAHNAEEITQAVFIILARKASSISPETVLAGWLYETARLTAGNFQRSEWRRTRREQEAYMQSTLEDAANEAAWHELAPSLEQAMSRLKPADRDALVLRYFQNKSLQEVGTALGIEERAAQKRVARALEKLRKLVTKRGLVLTAATIAATVSANSVQAAPAGLAATISATALEGSAVAASTMTLANETMKTMMWIKLNVAASLTGLLLLAGGALTIAAVSNKAPDIQGLYEGVLMIDEQAIQRGEKLHTRVVLKLVKTNDTYAATVDAIDAGRKGIPLQKITYEYPRLRIECGLTFLINGAGNSGLTLEGIVNAEGTEIEFHDGREARVLKRTTTPLAVPPRLAESDFVPRENSDLQGYWKGRLGDGPTGLPLACKIAEDSNGVFRAELDNPMQGGVGQPVAVVYNPPAVDLIVKTGSGMFHGTLNGGKTTLKGSWIQGGTFTPATFRLSLFAPESPSDTGKTFAFTSPTEVQGHWKGTLQAGELKLRLFLDIARLTDGSFAVELRSPDTPGNTDPIPATAFQYSPPDIRAEWKWIGGVLKSKLENGKLVGTLEIGLLSSGPIPVSLDRAANSP